MAKFADDSVMDAALGVIDNATNMTVCSQQPTTKAEADTTYALADVVVGGGDFTIGNGDTSGRKVTVAAQSGITIDTTGTGNHVALTDASDLLLVTTCNSISLTATNQVNFPAFDAEIGDPT